MTVAATALACAPGLGQDEDFRSRIPAACRTLEGCLLFRDEVLRRVEACQPTGSCSEASASADDVARRIQRFQIKRAEEQATADREALDRQERIEDQEKQERLRRQWLDDAVISCARVHDDEPCRSTNAMQFDDETRAACVDRCKRVLDQRLQGDYARALDDCVSQALASSTAPAFDCHFLVADPTLEARRVECAVACKDETEKLAALRPAATSQPSAPNANAPPPAPARTASPRPAPGGGGTALLCCDGTLSPTCLCPGYQGCCSHHHGVCGCQ